MNFAQVVVSLEGLLAALPPDVRKVCDLPRVAIEFWATPRFSTAERDTKQGHSQAREVSVGRSEAFRTSSGEAARPS